MRIYLTIFLSIVLLSMFSCNGKLSDKEREAFKTAMKEREIKKVSPGELNDTALKRGQLIADSAQKILLNSPKATTDSLLNQEITTANTNLFSQLDQKFQVTTQWIGGKMLDKPNQMTELERQLLDAYLYNIENDLAINENIQAMGDDSIIYTKPVMATALFDSLNSADDKLLGIWSVKLSKRALILDM